MLTGSVRGGVRGGGPVRRAGPRPTTCKTVDHALTRPDYTQSKYWLRPVIGGGVLHFEVVDEGDCTPGSWAVNFHGESGPGSFSVHGMCNNWECDHMDGVAGRADVFNSCRCDLADRLESVPGWNVEAFDGHISCRSRRCCPRIMFPRIEGGLTFVDDMIQNVYNGTTDWMTLYWHPENENQAELTSSWHCPVSLSVQYPASHFEKSGVEEPLSGHNIMIERCGHVTHPIPAVHLRRDPVCVAAGLPFFKVRARVSALLAVHGAAGCGGTAGAKGHYFSAFHVPGNVVCVKIVLGLEE